MRVLAVLTAMVVLATAAPAHADWQWTKWGMSPEEVTAASGGKTVRDAEGALSMPDPLVIQGCPFEIFFEFDNQQKLDAVGLYAEKDCYSDMVIALTSIYGAAIDIDTNSRIYADPAKGNKISIIVGGGTTTIKYRPLPTGL